MKASMEREREKEREGQRVKKTREEIIRWENVQWDVARRVGGR